MPARKSGGSYKPVTYLSDKSTNTSGPMRRTTKKGAYKKNKVVAFQNRRRPFVETKQREDYVIQHLNNSAAPPGSPGEEPYPFTADMYRTIPDDNAITNIPVHSFCRMVNGTRDYEMIGDNVFSKSLNMKLKFRFPQRDEMINTPFRMYVVHGWVTSPLSATQRTNPSATEVTQGDVDQHIVNQVAEYFDQKVDEMRWQTREYNNIKILGYRRIKVPDGVQTPLPTGGTGAQGENGGTVPDTRMSISWPTNKKIHYTLGTETQNGSETAVDIQNFYPNNQWLPWVVIYSPDWEALKTDPGGTQVPAQVQLNYNSIHHYSDS